MGTASFALPSLRTLVKNKRDVVAVYTQPPRRAGRGNKIQMSSVGLFAKANNLKLFYPENFANSFEIENLKSLKPDIVLVVAFGVILPENILRIPRIGFFNVHASILPRWRGAAPVQRALLSGDKKTGVSIIKLEPSLDTGPIVFERQIQVETNETAGSLQHKLSLIGANLTDQLCTNVKNLNFRTQDGEGVSYARKISKSETQIDWEVDAQEVDRQIRAFSPTPGAWFNFENERIKILQCQISNGKGKPGLIMDDYFQVACRKGSIMPIKLQRAGKSSLSIEEFRRGYKAPIGEILRKC